MIAMPYKVTIKTGLSNVVIGGRGLFNAGDVVMLTDQELAMVRPGSLASLFEGGTVTAVNTSTTSPYS